MQRAVKIACQLQKGQSVSIVTQQIEGTIIQCTTKSEVESAIMEMCKKRFLLTSNTPLMYSSNLACVVGYLGDTSTSADILQGTFSYSADDDTVTKEVLTMLSAFAATYSKRRLNTQISIQYHNKFQLYY